LAGNKASKYILEPLLFGKLKVLEKSPGDTSDQSKVNDEDRRIGHMGLL